MNSKPANARLGQSRASSAIESVVNVAVGYGVAVAAQSVIFPVFGIHVGAREHMELAGFFTLVSLARSYILRRIFNSRMLGERIKNNPE